MNLKVLFVLLLVAVLLVDVEGWRRRRRRRRWFRIRIRGRRIWEKVRPTVIRTAIGLILKSEKTNATDVNQLEQLKELKCEEWSLIEGGSTDVDCDKLCGGCPVYGNQCPECPTDTCYCTDSDIQEFLEEMEEDIIKASEDEDKAIDDDKPEGVDNDDPEVKDNDNNQE